MCKCVLEFDPSTLNPQIQRNVIPSSLPLRQQDGTFRLFQAGNIPVKGKKSLNLRADHKAIAHLYVGILKIARPRLNAIRLKRFKVVPTHTHLIRFLEPILVLIKFIRTLWLHWSKLQWRDTILL